MAAACRISLLPLSNNMVFKSIKSNISQIIKKPNKETSEPKSAKIKAH